MDHHNRTFLDRRSFLGTSLTAVVALNSSSLRANRPPVRLSSARDRRFMSYCEHRERVGERRALRSLRDDLFRVTLDRCFVVSERNRDEQIASRLAGFYSRRTERHCCLNLLPSCNHWGCAVVFAPSQASAIHHWWLFASQPAATTPHLSILYVSSIKSPEHRSAANWLAARITFRMHRHRQRIQNLLANHRQLVQAVNRQIIRAMRNFPR